MTPSNSVKQGGEINSTTLFNLSNDQIIDFANKKRDTTINPNYGVQVDEQTINGFNETEAAINGIEETIEKIDRYSKLKSRVTGQNKERNAAGETTLQPEMYHTGKKIAANTFWLMDIKLNQVIRCPRLMSVNL